MNRRVVLWLAVGLVLGLITVSCSDPAGPADREEGEHGHGGHEHGGHGHGEGVAIGVTAWSDQLELFAEHPPAVVGQEVAFLAHVTVLDGFRALEDARVRLTLRGPAELTAEAPMLRSGIYRPALVPTVAGTYEGTLSIIEGGEGAVGPFEVVVYPTQAAADEAHPPDEDEGGTISFLKEQQWRVPFGTAFAARGRVRPSVEASGTITTPPGGLAHVHAPTAGRVIAPAGGFPVPGARVAAGAVLATFAPTPGAPEDAARAELAVIEAEARAQASRIELDRVERMLVDQAVPERRRDEAQRSLRVAEAALASARRARSLFASARSGRGAGSWRITAPIAGVIDAAEVSPGEAVSAEDLLFRIVDPDVLWLEAEVPEVWASRFVADASASFRMVGEERWHRLSLGEGEGEGLASMVYTARTIDPQSRTVRVVYALGERDDSLRVGAAAHVLVPIGEPIDAVLVPRGAVLDVEGRSVVYVQVEGEAFAERVVRLGPSEGDRVAVESGIDAGERVVTEGAHLIRLAGSGGTVGHGHVH